MSLIINSIPALTCLSIPFLQQLQIEASVLRLDAVHPVVSGNKWYKLKGYLEKAETENKMAVVTFGGAYSNHILATAAACKHANLRCLGIIRGEQPTQLSPTLADAKSLGMEFLFVSREAYKSKALPPSLHEIIAAGEYIIVPEGGYGEEGMMGIASILPQLPEANFTHILCAVGTGTTLAGFAQSAGSAQTVIGISALKNNFALESAVSQLLPPNKQQYFKILHDFHFGGYAKYSSELLQFMNEWYQKTGIPSDFVYTGKLFFAFEQLSHQRFFPRNSRILLVHSGGLQGNRSLKPGTLIF